MTYLPNDLLVKVDRFDGKLARARSPFLDREVIEFAASLPRMKMRRFETKSLLKKVAAAVPRSDLSSEDGIRCSCRPLVPRRDEGFRPRCSAFTEGLIAASLSLR